MTTFLISVILGGSCQSVACQVATQVAFQNVAVPYVAVDPYWYVAGRESQVEQRLQKLEQILEQQVQINQRLIHGVQASTESTVTSQAKAIVNEHCLRCHNGESAKAGFRMDGEISIGDKLLAVDKVETGEMPPKPNTELSDDDFQVLRAWANEDKAAVRAFFKKKGG